MTNCKEKEIKKLISSVLCSSPTGLTIKRFSSDFYNLVGKQVPYKSFGYPNVESYLRSIPDVCEVQGTGDHAILVHVVSKNLEHMDKLILKQKTAKTNIRRRTLTRPTGIRWPDELKEDHFEDSNSVSSSSTSNSHGKNYIPTKYNELIKFICKKKSLTSNDSKVTHNANCHSIKIVSQLVQDRLSSIIKEHPGGLISHALPAIYKKRYNDELDPYEFNCTSISELCCMLDKKIFNVTKPNKEYYLLYDIALPEPIDTSYLNPYDEKGYPPDFKIYGEELEVQTLSRKFKNSDYIPIKVTNIIDPQNFYFQYEFDEEFINRRDYLLDKMQLFYAENSKKCVLHKVHLLKNLNCVALIDDYYYRAIILHSDNDHVNVFLHDFGDVTNVKRNHLFYLHDEFSLLPKQAIFAGLALIKPKNDQWSYDSVKRFVELVEGRQCMGLIINIDKETNKVNVIVTDVTDSKIDIIINDILIDEGFASPDTKDS